jgi:hypothetical protein
VEFGISAGFIHVIDDEQEFPRTFGADVVAGVLEIPGEIIARLKRKPAQEVVDVWSVLWVYSYSHALGRRKPLWICSVLHSMNLTGPNRFDLDVIKCACIAWTFYSVGFGVANATVTACNLLGPD